MRQTLRHLCGQAKTKTLTDFSFPCTSSEKQASARVPDDAWEFHARKNANDAAYQGLDFAPYCSTMPVVPLPPASLSQSQSPSSSSQSSSSFSGGEATAVPKWAWKKRAPR